MTDPAPVGVIRGGRLDPEGDASVMAAVEAERQVLVADVEAARDAIAHHKGELSEARDRLADALAEAREAGVPMKVLVPAAGLKRAMIHRAITERHENQGNGSSR